MLFAAKHIIATLMFVNWANALLPVIAEEAVHNPFPVHPSNDQSLDIRYKRHPYRSGLAMRVHH
jgi:hypothetical protein